MAAGALHGDMGLAHRGHSRHPGPHHQHGAIAVTRQRRGVRRAGRRAIQHHRGVALPQAVQQTPQRVRADLHQRMRRHPQPGAQQSRVRPVAPHRRRGRLPRCGGLDQARKPRGRTGRAGPCACHKPPPRVGAGDIGRRLAAGHHQHGARPFRRSHRGKARGHGAGTFSGARRHELQHHRPRLAAQRLDRVVQLHEIRRQRDARHDATRGDRADARTGTRRGTVRSRRRHALCRREPPWPFGARSRTGHLRPAPRHAFRRRPGLAQPVPASLLLAWRTPASPALVAPVLVAPVLVAGALVAGASVAPAHLRPETGQLVRQPSFRQTPAQLRSIR